MDILKVTFRACVLAAAVLAGTSCRHSGKVLLPNVSGKAGEVIVVMDKDNWEGAAGSAVRGLLAAECQFLPQSEPLYTLANVPTGSFTDIFKIHRNIVYFEIGSSVEKNTVTYRKDVWSTPQCVIQVSARNSGEAASLLEKEGKTIVGFIEQAERDRVINNSILYEERSLAKEVKSVFGGSPHFPMGYHLKKKTADFIWIDDEKQYSTQGVLIYSYPAEGNDDFTLEKIINKRNEVMKANVPGMFENTWMTTSDFWTPTIEHLRYQGRHFTQVRGLWEVQNDYMGGPFVSHSFYSRDGKKIIVTEAFVYAPRYDKRQYLRQVESILYSWEWND
ncbi:MAG: DUF4837 family protein [Bacteroidales bacterium]|nr:DUF4837 family protein [Bacteroidales bacterium]